MHKMKEGSKFSYHKKNKSKKKNKIKLSCSRDNSKRNTKHLTLDE